MSQNSRFTYKNNEFAFSIRESASYLMPDGFGENPKNFIGVPVLAKNKNNRRVYVIYIPEMSYENLGEYYVRTFPTKQKAEKYAHEKYLKEVYVTPPEWGDQYYYESKEELWDDCRELLIGWAKEELDELDEGEGYSDSDTEERARLFLESVPTMPIFEAKKIAKRGG